MASQELEELAKLAYTTVPEEEIRRLIRRVASGQANPHVLPSGLVVFACKCLSEIIDYVDNTQEP